MTPIELMADAAVRSGELVKMTLADFSEADMLVRPCAGANHAAWQLGHLCHSETMMMASIKAGAMPELPAGFADRFNKNTAGKDDSSAFLPKAKLLEVFLKTRQASAAIIRTLTQQDLDRPGPERMQAIVPTVGHLVLLLPSHTAMHLGQMQAIRRKLGKPLLF